MTKIEQIAMLFNEVNHLQANAIGVDPISDEHADKLISYLIALRDELNHIDQEADDS